MSDLEKKFEKFIPSDDGAQPTNRLIPGADSAMDPQEWVERGTIDGAPYAVYYLFSADEASAEDPGDYPWDADHVDRIEPVDE